VTVSTIRYLFGGGTVSCECSCRRSPVSGGR